MHEWNCSRLHNFSLPPKNDKHGWHNICFSALFCEHEFGFRKRSLLNPLSAKVFNNLTHAVFIDLQCIQMMLHRKVFYACFWLTLLRILTSLTHPDLLQQIIQSWQILPLHSHKLKVVNNSPLAARATLSHIFHFGSHSCKNGGYNNSTT